MMIDINKKYKTQDGFDVEIFKIIPEDDFYPSEHRVLGAVVQANGKYDQNCWMINGRFKLTGECQYDLVEASPYVDFKINDPVYVWNEGWNIKSKRHFAGVTESGRPLTFINGMTSWTINNTSLDLAEWDYCEKVLTQ